MFIYQFHSLSISSCCWFSFVKNLMPVDRRIRIRIHILVLQALSSSSALQWIHWGINWSCNSFSISFVRSFVRLSCLTVCLFVCLFRFLFMLFHSGETWVRQHAYIHTNVHNVTKRKDEWVSKRMNLMPRSRKTGKLWPKWEFNRRTWAEKWKFDCNQGTNEWMKKQKKIAKDHKEK